MEGMSADGRVWCGWGWGETPGAGQAARGRLCAAGAHPRRPRQAVHRPHLVCAPPRTRALAALATHDQNDGGRWRATAQPPSANVCRRGAPDGSAFHRPRGRGRAAAPPLWTRQRRAAGPVGPAPTRSHLARPAGGRGAPCAGINRLARVAQRGTLALDAADGWPASLPAGPRRDLFRWRRRPQCGASRSQANVPGEVDGRRGRAGGLLRPCFWAASWVRR